MFRLIIFFIVFLPVAVLGQATGKFVIKDISSRWGQSEAHFVLNGQLTSKAKLKRLNVKDVACIDVIKTDSTAVMHGPDYRSTVIVATKSYAAEHYQKILSALCPDLQRWLVNNGKNDTQLRYFIDDVEQPQNNDGKLSLYRLGEDSIESVTMVQDEPAGSKYAAKIKIVTKK